MSFTPYDWNQAVQTRTEYIEERLRDGSPVVGLSIPEGVLLVTVRRTQRKIYEIYDRLVFGGIGHQSDVENIRNAALDFAHREGFQRSPDDVTAHRLVSSVLSPALKKAFGDPFTAPFIFRGLFAELGDRAEDDLFYTLGFDGEFKAEPRYSVVAGSLEGENRMIDLIHGSIGGTTDRTAALRLGLEAWATGRLQGRRGGFARRDEDDDAVSLNVGQVLREELAEGTVEAGLLERNTNRESKFRLLRTEELVAVTTEYR